MIDLVKKVIRSRIKPYLRMLIDPVYRYRHREIKRLESLPRYQPTTTSLLGEPSHLVDAVSFLSTYHQIFERQIYHFVSPRESPIILDCGAYIGLGILYWKRIYPAAHIVAFEPDPVVFRTLVKNCTQWELSGVELVNKAVWNADGDLPFWVEGADAGHLLPSSKVDAENSIAVPAVRLKHYLQLPVDLLKLDIEGAEVEVILDCADSLDRVDRLFVEYHSFVGQEQRIDSILSALRSADFRIHIQPELVSSKPFVKRLNDIGMDQRLNIFAYRDHQ